MPRKRKRRSRRLSMYKVFGLHVFLFVLFLLALRIFYGEPVDGGIDITGAPFALVEVLTLWYMLMFLHLGYVILMTLDRVMRRFSRAEAADDERLADQLLQEVADLRAAWQQQAAAESSARLVEKPGPASGNLEALTQDELERAARL